MADVLLEWTCEKAPVQAEGTIDGVPFYFRSRWHRWSIGIGGSDPIECPEWFCEERYGDTERYDASFMPMDEARGFIVAAFARYRAERG